MNRATRHLALAELEPGMELSEELLDKQGKVLLPKGATLTERIIGLLPSHDIGMVSVAGADVAAIAIDVAAVTARLDQLFRKNDPDNASDWATGILRRYVLDHRLGREVEQ